MKDPDYGYEINGRGFCNADLNSDGFRDREFTPKKDDEFLITIIGDSLVYGPGLLIKDRFTNLLQKKLNKIRKTRVFNLGKCGSNLYQNYIRDDEFRKKLNPDLVIFGISENDLLIDRNLRDSPYSEHDILDKKIVYSLRSSDDPLEYSKRVFATLDKGSMNYLMFLELSSKMPRDKTLYYLLTSCSENLTHHKLIDEFNKKSFFTIENFSLYSSKYRKYAKSNSCLEISEKERHLDFRANQMFAERLYQEIVENSRWRFNKID
ncbi:SGNH/GDSL hydrolase family protein [Candidatus Collierbacteria bacterium]|nr:SGNH/GDSL hydrolase family protein [Candidatus Collierbacteria bacterium]